MILRRVRVGKGRNHVSGGFAHQHLSQVDVAFPEEVVDLELLVLDSLGEVVVGLHLRFRS